MNAPQTHNRQPIPGIKDTLAISSGKGGVGKSTLCANLAVSLADQGLQIGLLDADIYGPNIPGLLGLEGRPTADDGRIQPLTVHGLKAISMGLLIDPGTPVVWRGPMLAKMMHQFLFNVTWGELDLLLIDLPPGTGDVQITLTQVAPLTAALIITTPSAIALEDVRRGVEMFRQTEVPIVGLVENMSYFHCDNCDHTDPIFGTGGGRATASRLDIPYLGEIPLDPLVRSQADAGEPVVRAHPHAGGSQALAHLAADIGAYFQRA